MQFDKDWLGKAAGWRAFQDGRKLHAAGRVLESQGDGVNFSGLLEAKPRPRKVRVKLVSANEVDTHCTCAENRRDGAFCAHGVALLLHILEGPASEPSARPSAPRSGATRSGSSPQKAGSLGASAKSVPEGRKTPLYVVSFKLRSLEAALKGRPMSLSLRPVEESIEADEADEALAAWMSSLYLERDREHLMLQVDGPQLRDLLRALGGHSRVSLGGQGLDIAAAGRRPSLEWHLPDRLEMHADRAPWRLIHGRWWYLGAELWQPGPESSGWIDVLMREGRMSVKQEDLIARLDDLGGAFELVGKAFESLEFIPVEPSIRVAMEGSGGYLEAHPFAAYEGAGEIELLDAQGLAPWALEGADNGKFGCRDRSAEWEVVEFLQKAGFRRDEGEATLRLKGEELVVDFLAADYARMEAMGWTLQASNTLTKLLSKIERISPVLTQRANGSGWLELELSYPGSGGQHFSAQQIQEVLRKGRKRFKLPNGKLGIIDQQACEDLQELLAESSPKQMRPGQYRVKAAFAASLKAAVRGELSDALDLELQAVRQLSGLKAKLRGYQELGVAWMWRHCRDFGGALLADDMGLGKTLQSIALMLLARERDPALREKPALVVAPTSLLSNWQDELERFAPELSCLVWHGGKRDERRHEIGEHQVLLTSYGVLARDRALFAQSEWSLAFLDEASLVRNPDTEIAKACHALRAEARIAITGTPVENSVRDLWSAFQFVLPGYLGPRKAFRERYEKACQESPPDPAVLRRLSLRVEPHLLRRLKQEVATELPAKQESVVWCGLSQDQSGLYQQLLREGQEAIADARRSGGAGAAKLQTLTTLLRLRQTCCDIALTGLPQARDMTLEQRSSKLSRLLELLRELEANGHRALIFSQFTSQLDTVGQLLALEGMDFCRLDGATRKRGEVVRRFQSDEGPSYFLISLKAGGYGLNLTRADVVIHLDPWWNPAAERQATDRAHRIGQNRAVTVYKFITRGTVEEKILRLQQAKLVTAGGAIGEALSDGPEGLGDLDALLESEGEI